MRRNYKFFVVELGVIGRGRNKNYKVYLDLWFSYFKIGLNLVNLND